MSYIFEVIEAKAQPILSMRTVTSVGNLPKELGRIYGAICTYLAKVGEQPQGPAFSAYYNTDMENLEVEIGFPVAKEIAGEGDILASEIPGGKRAFCMYKGPYKGMASTYEALTKWIAENGYTPTGVAYEFYYNSPDEVPESELLTKIEFPLK